ncbi:MAG: MBL fold metallo-hydrolase [Aquamicrobium sp.]|uniref:MBL fold metallo-hydrolase n=1 Tax=Aquamicrobium sp. TaxID=1872579 RepID=UPI00349E64DC|nr:MBL fold metallo-hydrolase [Aquamicrobium sp.]
MRLTVPAAAFLALFAPLQAVAQDAPDPVPSQCIAIAEALPKATYASFAPAPVPPFASPAQAREGVVTITYAGHSTYVIETPAGVRVATDFSGHYGFDPLPRVVTMNRAHGTHFTDFPDPGIEHVLRGWNPDGGPARHALTVDDVYIRNVPTDIRSWGGGMVADGNSIFIFEVAGLCIGHLGHLHHHLEDAHYAAIGRLDILMVPIDGGMTLSVGAMSEIAKRLYSSLILPMHRHSTPLREFTARMGEDFEVRLSEERSLTVSLRDLPRRPTILVLKGV